MFAEQASAPVVLDQPPVVISVDLAGMTSEELRPITADDFAFTVAAAVKLYGASASPGT